MALLCISVSGLSTARELSWLRHSGKSHEGKERLLFSLRQLEYLQYYIHEMRLTDPEWVLRLDGDEIKEAKPRKDEDAESDAARKVQDYGKIGEWVPLPAEFERPEEYASIVSRLKISIPSYTDQLTSL